MTGDEDDWQHSTLRVQRLLDLESAHYPAGFMENTREYSLLVTLVVALGIGLMIGWSGTAQRAIGPEREIAGVRTYALVSLLGACGSLLNNPWMPAAPAQPCLDSWPAACSGSPPAGQWLSC